MATHTRFSDLKSTILDCMDVVAEYTSLGVEVVGKEGHSSEWVTCRAYQKEDANPSAEICVKGPSKGQYVDFSGGIGEGRSVGFFDFCVAAGKCPHWTDALKYYAKQMGLEFPNTLRDPAKNFERMNRPNPTLLETWTTARNTTPQAVWDAGGFMAMYPTRNPEPCVMLPIYGMFGPADSPSGFVAWKRSALPFVREDGSDGPKMMTVKNSESGLMGRLGLDNLAHADVVWKTEGPSDMLALMSIIPEDLRKSHVVITNSAGCAENPKPFVVQLLAGKVVNVIHDADKPGQMGAKRWASALSECSTVRNIELPYPLTDTHGKDLRDWISEGGRYTDLLAMAATAPIVEPATVENDPLETDRAILDSLGLEPLGEYPNQAVALFSLHYRKIVTIPDIDKLTYTRLLQLTGPIARKLVAEETAEGNQVTLRNVKGAIAVVSAEHPITPENTKGQGVWMTPAGHVVMVGLGEAITWDGVVCETVTKPRYEDFILDFSSGKSFWPSNTKERLEHYDRSAGAVVVQQIIQLFSRWRWENPAEIDGLPPKLVTGLILATVLQTIFKWRPMVSVTGESESGKTTLVTTIVGLFGLLGERLANVTEPAIRQYIQTSARALFLDEFEATTNRQKIFELLRTSSDGSKLIRGTQDQRGKSYGLKHIAWMSAIEINLQRAPDINRFIEMSLLRPELFGELNIPSVAELSTMGQEMLLACVFYARKIRDVADQLAAIPFKTFNTREVQTFIAPAAALAVVSGDEEHAEAILREMLSWVAHRDVPNDQQDLLQAILSTEVRYQSYMNDPGNYTIGMLIQEAVRTEPEKLLDFLESKGIKLGCSCHSEEDYSNYVFFSKQQVERLLRGTQWEGQSVVQILKRLPGALVARRTIAGSGQLRGINIPLECFGIKKNKENTEDGIPF